jgi:lysophospholipase L1-like esterase
MKKLYLLLALFLSLATADAQQWVGTFATAPEFTGKGDMPQTTTLANTTLRQVVKVSLGGSRLQVQLSNEFSREAVEIKSVYIADARDSSDIDARTATYLSFGGRRSVTIEPGEAVYSDALNYALKPLQRLAVTICYGSRVPVNATSHRGSRTHSYIARGTVKPGARFHAIEKPVHWYNISKINVWSAGRAVAVLGNSITDGRGSTTDLQNRWPDRMAEALGGQVGVLNLGIGGNCVVEGGLSEPLMRFDRDILGQKGVDRLIIFEGTNDIGTCNADYEQKARRLIEAYGVLIAKARAAGMKVYMGTITPTGGHGWYSFFREAMRQTVNEWIRTNKEIAGVIDFDELTRDTADSQRLKADYSDDWLHLNPRGYEAMGGYAATVIDRP